MADIIKFDLGTNRVIEYRKSVHTQDYMGLPDVLINPSIPNAPQKWWKVDNGQVVEMSQAEKDALLAEEQQAIIDAENARITALDNKMDIDLSGIVLTKADNAIDNIGNLTDAKVFLKKLCRFIIKFTVNQ